MINSEDRYPNATVVLEMLDFTRSRGAEPYEQNITLAMELAAMLWSDSDGDGWADQTGTALSDHCPSYPGESFRLRQGCGDIDGDGLPDEMTLMMEMESPMIWNWLQVQPPINIQSTMSTMFLRTEITMVCPMC